MCGPFIGDHFSRDALDHVLVSLNEMSKASLSP